MPTTDLLGGGEHSSKGCGRHTRIGSAAGVLGQMHDGARTLDQVDDVGAHHVDPVGFNPVAGTHGLSIEGLDQRDRRVVGEQQHHSPSDRTGGPGDRNRRHASTMPM